MGRNTQGWGETHAEGGEAGGGTRGWGCVCAHKMPPSSGPGFVDGHLQESCPFTPDEAGVYAALARLVPAQAYSKADFVLKLACVRGYHKEKPRAETTAGELARILEWRDKNRMDEVRAAPTTRRGVTPCGGLQGKAPAGRRGPPPPSLACAGDTHARCFAACAEQHARRTALLSWRHGWPGALGAKQSHCRSVSCSLTPPPALPPTVPAAHATPGGGVPPVLAHTGPRRGLLRPLCRPGTDRGALACARV